VRRDPRHVFRALSEKTRVPETELERSLYVTLHGAGELAKATPLRPWTSSDLIDPSLGYPLEVYRTDGTRGLMEAFLIATGDDHEVANALGMSTDEVGAYRTLFFDTSKFKTDLDIMVYLQAIPEDAPNKALFKIAFHQGIGALRWHYCRNKGEVNPGDVVRTIMTDSFYRSLEHRGQPITSKAAKEAAKMANAALVSARVLLNDIDQTDSNIESLRMKFEEIRKNRTVEDLAKAGLELVH
jgi:hypothetical protein